MPDIKIIPANGPRLYPIELQYEPRVISGFRPTVEPHLGLHSGVLQHIVSEQNRHPGANYCLIADWHATTMWFERANMQEATLTTAAALLALGVNPYKTLLCAQSHLTGLGEMAWLLSCMTPESLLLRNPVSHSSALKGMRGTVQCREGEIVLRDAESIIASLFQGPDHRTRLAKVTKNVIFFVSAVPGIDREQVSKGTDTIVGLFGTAASSIATQTYECTTKQEIAR
jgi:tryptophanyl-tRNA synthetase